MADPFYEQFLRDAAGVEPKYDAPEFLARPSFEEEVAFQGGNLQRPDSLALLGLGGPRVQAQAKQQHALSAGAGVMRRQKKLEENIRRLDAEGKDTTRLRSSLEALRKKKQHFKGAFESAEGAEIDESVKRQRARELAIEAVQKKREVRAMGLDRDTESEQFDIINKEVAAKIESEFGPAGVSATERLIATAAGGEPGQEGLDEDATYLEDGTPAALAAPAESEDTRQPGSATPRRGGGGRREGRLERLNRLYDESLDRQAASQLQIQNEMRAEFEENDQRLEAYAQRSREADEELQARLAQLDEEEDRARFIASHPNASEAELKRAHSMLNDPGVSEARKEKIRTALESTKELNPYRMVSSPGGMLAAVASIVAGGIGGAKDPAEQLKGAMQHDLNLQKQRQASRREKVLQVAKQRGKEVEAREMLRQQEAFENNVQLHRYSSAMEMFKQRSQDAAAIEGFEQAKLAADAQLENTQYHRRQAALARKAQTEAMNAAQMQKVMERLDNPLRTMGFELLPGYSEEYGKEARQAAAVYKNLPTAFDTVKRLGGFRMLTHTADAKELKDALYTIGSAIALDRQGGSGILRDQEVMDAVNQLGNPMGANSGAVVENIMRKKKKVMNSTGNILQSFGVVARGTPEAAGGLVEKVED